MTKATPTVTKNADGSTTESYKISEMSLEQLVHVSQGLGRDIDKLREKRMVIRKLIEQKNAEGHNASIDAQIKKLQAQRHGTAPGAVIDATAKA